MQVVGLKFFWGIAKWLRHRFLIPTFTGSSPVTPAPKRYFCFTLTRLVLVIHVSLLSKSFPKYFYMVKII